MANANTENTNTQVKLARVQEYAREFVGARKGEIKVSTSDLEVLSDLTEVFFGARIDNKQTVIRLQSWCDKPKYNSELIIRQGEKIYKLYSQVSNSKLEGILG